MLLYSKTLKKDVNFATFERENDFGKPIKVIFHDSLQDVIHNQTSAKYAFNFVKATPEHTVVVCEMADSTGRRVVEIGESTPSTLDTEIAKNYPSLIASQRAFDRAAIRYLDLPGKVFSNMEISIIDEISAEDVIAEAEAQPKAAGGIVSSVVEDEDVLNLADDDVVIDDNIAVESTPVADEDVNLDVIGEFDTSSVLDDMSSTEDINLFDVDEEPKEKDVANHVITMSGQYAKKELTIAQIYEINPQWLTWVAEKFTPYPKNEAGRIDKEAVQKFLALKKEGKL